MAPPFCCKASIPFCARVCFSKEGEQLSLSDALYTQQGGKILERVNEHVECCYFQYASPLALVSGRDTCYLKVRKNLASGDKQEGFILSYRSTKRGDCPPNKDFVRLEFRGAHLIEPLPDGEQGFLYTYIQHVHILHSLHLYQYIYIIYTYSMCLSDSVFTTVGCCLCCILHFPDMSFVY